MSKEPTSADYQFREQVLSALTNWQERYGKQAIGCIGGGKICHIVRLSDMAVLETIGEDPRMPNLGKPYKP